MKIPQYTAADIAPLTRRYTLGRNISLACLIALCLIFTWVNLREDTGSWVRWCLQTLPLALFIPGCLRGHFRTYSWLCFVVLFYFTGCVVALMGPSGHWLDAVGVALTSVLFCSAMMTSRWRQHSNLARQQAATDH